MDLVVMAFFNGIVAFTLLRFLTVIEPNRQAVMFFALLLTGAFCYMVMIPFLIFGMVFALVGTAISGLIYISGQIYKTTGLDASRRTVFVVNNMQMAIILISTVLMFNVASKTEPVMRIFGVIGFYVVAAVICVLCVFNIYCNFIDKRQTQ